MDKTLESAIAAEGEQDWVDFKSEFDPGNPVAWCEMVKDLVAMANSGGGFVLVGVDDNGNPSCADIVPALGVDPATVTDKVRKYTALQFGSFSLHKGTRRGQDVLAIAVARVPYPIVFTNPGTYELPDKKQGRAFSTGQVYFRHGTKSEPGTTNDLREFVDREVARIRRDWLGNIRKVVEAPAGAVVSVVPVDALLEDRAQTIPARLVHAPEATAVPWRNPNDTHPYRQKEAVIEINRRMEGKGHVNGFDIQMARRHFNMEKEPNLAYKPKFGSFQYSHAAVDWVVQEFQKDPTFFRRFRKNALE